MLMTALPVVAQQPETPAELPAPAVPAAEQPAPTAEQAAPAAEQPAPAAEQAAPAAEQPAPTAEQAAPAAEQPAPTAEQAAPAAEQPAPAPEPAPEAQPAPQPEQPAHASAPAPQPAPATVAPDSQSSTVNGQSSLVSAYRGIVKVEVAASRPDYRTPWQTGSFGRGNGTGFMVAPGLFLTNAHVVSNAERIYLMPYADSRQLPARVKYISHEADLAMLEVADASAFADVPCLKLSTELPNLEDEVRAIGYPIGGKRLSVTRGIISRIDTIKYAHTRQDEHLAVQIDAAINPGNSGGPVLKGDEVVGVAFQGLLEANSTGYMIPAPVISHFLQDVKDGKYDGYVELGAEFAPMENPAMRRHYGLDDNAPGCLVANVIKGSCADGILQAGDVVVRVNGHSVDRSAMIELDGVRVGLEELAERAFSGDVITMCILRDGQEHQVELKPSPLAAFRVMAMAHDERPRYVHYAGLVFQPLHFNVIASHNISPRNFMVEMDAYLSGGFTTRDDVVVLTRILPDEVNARLDNTGRGIVERVNGVEVKGLAHLYSLLYPEDTTTRPPYTVIEMAGAPRPLVIDNSTVDVANERISTNYSIPSPARLNP